MSPLRVYWWRWKHPVRTNFGDELSAPLIEELTGRSVRWSPVPEADLVAAGSILTDVLREHVTYPPFWGTGFHWPYREEIPEQVRPHAVRGRLTAEHFPADQRSVMALGDPGILANRLLDRPGRTRYSIGVVPHFRDTEHPAVLDLAGRSGVRIIDIGWTPTEVAREIAACETVLSSSLHGMIVADALDVPNVHLRMNESVGGPVQGPLHGLFKYRDYYSAFPGERLYEPWYAPDVVGLPTAEIVTRIHEHYPPPHGIQTLRDRLVAALPV
ncbi:polysaccharide pyruvyl transferase family protein [Isoptericola sp. b408]|uniref:polysaccharide pyruvyl transferase family protein n=1 Tax=Isoptericola sp. b408 TaxID=3064653 RepID=UPI002712B7BE|nr:polysaccharide pyruvyl transferase family protein [Isoptericola sp. b408]MDO8152728.1 polysaccharide pyruvyl transferase family protein [Isoptericola sp. b408]